MEKNVAGQKWKVFAFDRTDNTPKTGDAANITAYVSNDDGAEGAIALVSGSNPVEVHATNAPGYYEFALTQAQSNYNTSTIFPKSATADIQVIGCPATIDFVPPNHSDLGIESDGDLTKCDLVATTTTNTDMVGTDNALLAANVPTNFSSLGIEADGDITKVNTLDGHTAQTGDSYAVVNSGTFGNSALKTLVDALNDISVSDILTTAMTEDYGAHEAERTLAQMLYELKAFLTEFGIATTTYTTNKLDGTASGKTYTLDDGTNPTAIEETT